MAHYLSRFVASSIIAVAGIVAAAEDAHARSLIRDSEIESTLRQWADPLFAAAGLSPESVRILIVNDPALNAFVAGGQNLFINTGLLMRSESASQVIGVMAHETGHIAGGHLVRMGDAMGTAQNLGLLHTLLGLGIMVLGAAAGATGSSKVGGALIAGGQMAGQRTFLHYTQSEENAADQAGLAYLDRTGRSARGLLGLLKQLQDQELLVVERQDAYVRTHPMIRDRINTVKAHILASPASDLPDPPIDVERHARMRAKLIGFLERSGRVLRAYPVSDTSISARYARAVAFSRKNAFDLDRSLGEIDSLLVERPKDPFFNELKGQILFESGKGTNALSYYRIAVRLRPDDPLILTALAQVLIEVDDQGNADEAIALLERSSRIDSNNPTTWRLLAVAHGRRDNIGKSSLAAAEQALLEHRPRDAMLHVGRAERIFSEGTPSWLRVQDIRDAAEQEIALIGQS